MRSWIGEMKTAERGPFEAIRWFCEDGSVRPARAGCAGHGGGIQHGERNSRVKEMRAGGYVMVTTDVEGGGKRYLTIAVNEGNSGGLR
jgi:hypothetical protein